MHIHIYIYIYMCRYIYIYIYILSPLSLPLALSRSLSLSLSLSVSLSLSLSFSRSQNGHRGHEGHGSPGELRDCSPETRCQFSIIPMIIIIQYRRRPANINREEVWPVSSRHGVAPLLSAPLDLLRVLWSGVRSPYRCHGGLRRVLAWSRSCRSCPGGPTPAAAPEPSG